jgi:hypothetical protein
VREWKQAAFISGCADFHLDIFCDNRVGVGNGRTVYDRRWSMSVLIKGMEMPESCEECDFCIAIPDDSYFCDCPVIHGGLNITQAIEDDVTHPDCPLVEVPTLHGRLMLRTEDGKEYEIDG